MAAPTEFDPNPDNNTTIGGLNVGENCPAANINNAIRYLAATIRVTYNDIPDSSVFLTQAYPVFDNQPYVANRGAIIHHNDTANSSGRVFVVVDGSIPSGLNNGDIIFGI